MLVKDLQFYAPYYAEAYKRLAQDIPLIQLLTARQSHIEFYQNIPDDKWTYQYAEGKWSLQKVIQHWLDAELIFCYRALCIVRGEMKPFMGWDPDAYANHIDESILTKEKLLNSLRLQVNYTYNLFASFTPDDLKKIGNVNEFETEVAAIGFSIIAHEMHHRNVVKDKYLHQL